MSHPDPPSHLPLHPIQKWQKLIRSPEARLKECKPCTCSDHYWQACPWTTAIKLLTKTSWVVFQLFSHSVVSNSLQLHGLQHARPPWPSPSPRACSNSFPLSRSCHPTILSSVIPFLSWLQSFPASGCFPVSWLFVSGGQSIGASWVGTHHFWGRRLLCPPLSDKAIKLSFSTSPQTVSEIWFGTSTQGPSFWHQAHGGIKLELP